MSRPPLDSHDRAAPERLTWQDVLVSYAVVAAILVAFWVASQPLTATPALAVAAALVVGSRRAYGLVRCFYDCQGFAFDLGGRARITVSRLPADDAN